MNPYTLQGQGARWLSGVFKRIGFKNIKYIGYDDDTIRLHLKEGKDILIQVKKDA